MPADGPQLDIRPVAPQGGMDWANPAASAPTTETQVPSVEPTLDVNTQTVVADQGIIQSPDLSPAPHIETSDTSPVSRVKNPDGSSFDMIGSDPERAALRSDAMMKMKDLVQGNPDLEKFIQNTAGVSAEYVMSGLIQKTFDPELKSKLLDIYAEEAIAEGHYGSLIEGLAMANATELPIGKYDQAFLTGVFEGAMAKDPVDAWFMAQRMMVEGDRVLKPEEINSHNYDAWKGMEQRAFETYAERVLALEIPTDEAGLSNFRVDMEALYGSARFRDGGYENSAVPSDICRRIAEKKVELNLALGVPKWAYEDALRAKLDPVRIEELRRLANPSFIDQLRAAFRREGKSITPPNPSAQVK